MIRALVPLCVAVLALVAASAPGCAPACPSSERTFADGTARRDDDDVYYESSPPSGPFLPYEGNTLLHVKHKLGVRPVIVQVFLSFSEYPEILGGGGSSNAAGNQALYIKQDADEIAVKNDSCANYWIRVVASGPASLAAGASTSDAGGVDVMGAGTEAGNDSANEDTTSDDTTSDDTTSDDTTSDDAIDATP